MPVIIQMMRHGCVPGRFKPVENDTDEYDIIDAQHHFQDNEYNKTDDAFTGKQMFHISFKCVDRFF